MDPRVPGHRPTAASGRRQMSRRQLFLGAAAVASSGGAVISVAAGGSTVPGALESGRQQASSPAEISWFTSERVQGFTRLPTAMEGSPQFSMAGAVFAGLGAKVLVRHVKTDQGSVMSDDAVRGMVQEAHDNGVRLIGYYWISADAESEAAHPNWACRDVSNVVVQQKGRGGTTRGTYLDFLSSYGDLVEQRLLALAGLGLDGFYFDAAHWPADGCFASNLQQAFTTATGTDPPRSEDENDEAYRAYLDFQAEQTVALFSRWKSTVQAQFPSVVFVVSTTFIPALVNRRMTTRLAAVADAAKTEFRLALSVVANQQVFTGESDIENPPDDIRMALGWVVLRDAAAGRPPHVWGPRFATDRDALGFVGAVTTYGCIAAMDLPEANIIGNTARPSTKESVSAALALGRKVSDALGSATVYRWAAVHFSEASRNARGGDHVAAWREVLWPVTGAFGTLCRRRVPVGVVNDDQLAAGALDGVKLLVLPNPDELSDEQAARVRAFTVAGGTVLHMSPDWSWSEPGQSFAAASAFQAALGSVLDASPVRVTGGPEQMHAVSYRAGTHRVLVAITNEFTSVQQVRATTTATSTATAGSKRKPGTVKGVAVQLRLDGLARSATDEMTGEALTVLDRGDHYELTVPDFDVMALLSVQL